MKWSITTIILLFLKNLTGSGRFKDAYYRAQGYDIHRTAQVNGELDTVNPHLIHIHENALIGNGARIITHGPGVLPRHIHIGKGAYIGAGATVVGCNVGDGALIGAGCVVQKNIPPGTVVG